MPSLCFLEIGSAFGGLFGGKEAGQKEEAKTETEGEEVSAYCAWCSHSSCFSGLYCWVMLFLFFAFHTV